MMERTLPLLLPPPSCAPALLNANTAEDKLYWDRSHYVSPESQIQALSLSSTVYVGNLAFSTRSIHLLRCFEQVGPVANVHLGLDRFKKTPCGFAFVEFHHRVDALCAVANLTGTKLDGRLIRVELDAGFKPGRQYGRGSSGGQVRDDRGEGSGRDKQSTGERAQQQPTKPRWEPPNQAKGDDLSQHGLGEDSDTGNLPFTGKRSLDDCYDDDRENPVSKNPRWDGTSES